MPESTARGRACQLLFRAWIPIPEPTHPVPVACGVDNGAVLKHQGIPEPWYDRRTSPGTDIASQHCCDNMMSAALARHHIGEARVIPVILRPTHLEGAPFQQIQALPKDANPITRWANRDEAWADVVGGIRLAAESLRALNRPPP